MTERIGKVALIGPGAVGSYYGSLLFLSGIEIHFLFRSSYSLVKSKGLTIIRHAERGRKEVVYPLHAHRDSSSIGICDWVIIATKATANGKLPGIIGSLVGKHTKFLTLQNGMGNVESLASDFGKKRTILGGLCFTCINRTSPNIIESHLPGYIQFGQLGQKLNSEAESMVRTFETAGVRVKRAESLEEALWHKLCWNIPFNGIAIAAGGITTDLILANPDHKKRAHALMQEVRMIALSHGISIEHSFLTRQFELTEPMGPYKPSSLVDFLDDKPVEVEAIWGEALRRGRSKGVRINELERLYCELVELC